MPVRIPILSNCADTTKFPATINTWSFSNPNGYEVWRVNEATLNANGTVSITDLNDFVEDTSDVDTACRAGM